jgi:hypothetical protein
MRILPVVGFGLIWLGGSLWPSSGYAQEQDDKIILHGYFSQAFAKADGLPVYGITKRGTWDYRVLALQARYNITRDDQLVLQTRYERNGNSLLNTESAEVQWLYYQHRIGSFTAAIGKAPIPDGLYNNLREVGTVLPFYRAPPNFYTIGFETIEGVVLTHEAELGRWGLESSVYGGAIAVSFPYADPSGLAVVHDRTEYNFGYQFWLTTPIKGLRVGTQFQSFQVAATPTDTVRNSLFGGSAEWVIGRYFVRGEYQGLTLKLFGPGGTDEVEHDGWAETGVKVTDELSLNAQASTSVIHYPGLTYRWADDRALGISYALNPAVVFKLEGHRHTGYDFDKYVDVTQPPGKTKFMIVSVSTSF